MKRALQLIPIIMLFMTANATMAQPGRGTVLLNVFTGGVFADNSDRSLDDRLVLGVEGNFFVADRIPLTFGLDYNTAGSGYTSAAIGTRYYPAETFFLRHRTMISLQSRFNYDFLLGIGNDFMLNDNFAAEVNLDYHFVSQGIGVRFGLGVFL